MLITTQNAAIILNISFFMLSSVCMLAGVAWYGVCAVCEKGRGWQNTEKKNKVSCGKCRTKSEIILPFQWIEMVNYAIS